MAGPSVTPQDKHTDSQSDRECLNDMIIAMRYRTDFVCTENYGGVDNLSLQPNSNGHYVLNYDFTPAEDDVFREVVIKSIMRPRHIKSFVGAKAHGKVKVNSLSHCQLYRAVHGILNMRYPQGYSFGFRRTIDQIAARLRKTLTVSAWRTMYDQFVEIKQQGLPARDHEEWLSQKYEEAKRAKMQQKAASLKVWRSKDPLH